ncbi:T9SS type A sorting domain-containing protein, partial [bacterium]|nr:T9SS type A sorting domain-containing protein [bacterium]
VDAIGDGRVVYVGTDSQFVTTGLNPATEYFINVFSFNGDDLSTHYLTTSPLQGRQFTYASEPLEQPTDLLFSNITTTSCVVTFRQPSMRATGYLAIRHEGSFSAEIPVNGRKYSLGEELISGKVVAMGRDTSFVDTGLQEGAEYFYTIYAFNGDSQTCNFKIDAPLMGSKLIALQPQVLSLQLSEPISEENTAIVIRVQVSGTNPEVTLIYGNNANALEKELIFQNNLTDFTAQIPAEDVVSAGLWYRIKVTNAAGTAFSPSATGYYDLPVTIKDFNSIKQISHFSGGIPKEQWLLTGLPFETDDVYFSDVFGEQKQNKKNEAVNWLVKELNQDFRETVSMRNEKGYAVYHRLNTYKFFDEVIVNAVSRPRGAFDAIDLKPGWNLVAWPYAFEGNIQIKDVSKVRFIWTLNSDGGWESSGALRVKPYDAFLINNKSGDGTVESVLDWSVALGKSSAAGDPAGWSVPFILKTSAVSDRNNELGVSDNALDGWDVWDEDEPVNLTDVPQIYFVLAENDQMRRLAYDIRPSQTNGNVWEMVVDGISTKNDRLEWNLQNIPSTLAIAIVNTSINRWLDPAAQSVPLDPSIALQRFKIIIGQPTFVHDAVESIKENLPEQFELFSNFPNPFNPTTQIRFRVARSGNLDLKIFNILGQEVKTLTNGFYETGDYKVSWDGTDNRGLRVSSGIYFYRIKTASFLQTKKMILIK